MKIRSLAIGSIIIGSMSLVGCQSKDTDVTLESTEEDLVCYTCNTNLSILSDTDLYNHAKECYRLTLKAEGLTDEVLCSKADTRVNGYTKNDLSHLAVLFKANPSMKYFLGMSTDSKYSDFYDKYTGSIASRYYKYKLNINEYIVQSIESFYEDPNTDIGDRSEDLLIQAKAQADYLAEHTSYTYEAERTLERLITEGYLTADQVNIFYQEVIPTVKHQTSEENIESVQEADANHGFICYICSFEYPEEALNMTENGYICHHCETALEDEELKYEGIGSDYKGNIDTYCPSNNKVINIPEGNYQFIDGTLFIPECPSCHEEHMIEGN